MATAQMSPDLSKPSFAKVAASVSKENLSPSTRAGKPTMDDPAIAKGLSAPTGPVIANGTPARASVPPHTMLSQDNISSRALDPRAVDKVALSLDDLSLAQKAPSLVVNGSGSTTADRTRPVASRGSGSDDSQRADSSSELGTKPPSLDGKSITSGTTFALDEKESLRPDDSASVMAAAEDDDAFSVRGSLIAGSRMGSEVASRSRGIQLGDIPERRLGQPMLGAHPQEILAPQSASLEQPPGLTPAMPLGSDVGSSDALNVIYRQAPDEKLLEALATPRDRFFLLRLEKDVIDFVQDSTEPYMDLPPSNSFCRMLTHKLADYYHMTHSYEPHIGSVRIFRTPFCRVPPSLASMDPAPSVSDSSTPPPLPAVLPKRIMRRGQDGEGGPMSSGASKATSEDGSDSKDKLPLLNQKLTREEREELYKLARERIFGSSEETAPEESNGENDMSRASSVSTNNRSNVGKRGKGGKQRRDDSDSFDSRNQYAPYWGPQQQTWVPQQQPHPQHMAPPAGQFNGQIPATYPGTMAPGYAAQPPPAYPTAQGMMPNAAYPGYAMPQYTPQPAPQRYQPGGSPMAAYGAPVPPAQQQNWQPGYNQASYQSRLPPAPAGLPGPPPPAGPPGPPGPPGPGPHGLLNHNGIPYAFGQLPANAVSGDPKSQHPIPGSYNRNHAFNPKTQSFVPGGSAMPAAQPPQPPFTAPASHHGSPQIGAPHLVYAGYQQPMPHPYGGGYGMARQGSNTSMHAYHPQQHITPPHTQHGPPMPNLTHGPVQHIPQNPPAHIPNRPSAPQGPNQIFSHLPTYGNPATLPQKPATGI